MMVGSMALVCLSAAADCGDLSIEADGAVVRDSASGLLWARCPAGRGHADCQGEAQALRWVDSLNRARAAERGGETGWRMPRIEELAGLYEKLVTCDDEPFRHLREAPLWSASANLDFATSAWAFDFSTGEAIVKPRDHALQLLLVSGPAE